MIVLSRGRLAELYKRESNSKVKERLLLILRVEADEQLPAHVVKDMHRTKPWASYWLNRYNKEGIDGLRDKPKSGRIPQISLEVVTRIRKRKINRKQTRMDYYTTSKRSHSKRVRNTIPLYTHTHIYRLLHRWGFKQKVPRKIYM